MYYMGYTCIQMYMGPSCEVAGQDEDAEGEDDEDKETPSEIRDRGTRSVGDCDL